VPQTGLLPPDLTLNNYVTRDEILSESGNGNNLCETCTNQPQTSNSVSKSDDNDNDNYTLVFCELF
jgi:hypothetical protein